MICPLLRSNARIVKDYLSVAVLKCKDCSRLHVRQTLNNIWMCVLISSAVILVCLHNVLRGLQSCCQAIERMCTRPFVMYICLGLQGCPCTRQFLCAHDNLGVFGGADVCNVKQHNWYFGHGGETPVTLSLQELGYCVQYVVWQISSVL